MKHKRLLRRICLQSATCHSCTFDGFVIFAAVNARPTAGFTIGAPTRVVNSCFLVHNRTASESFAKSQLSQSGSVQTRSLRIAGNLSSVIDTAPLTCSSLFSVCRACTQYVSFSLNSPIFLGFGLDIEGRSKIPFI